MNSKVRPSSRTAESDWIADRLAPFGSGVGAIVPAGFEAYIRILHPATGRDGASVTWSEMAARSGRTMHRLAQFEAINCESVTGVDSATNGPDSGTLPATLLEALCAALSAHTRRPESCFFCLWEGYGWLRDSGGGGSIVFTPIGYSGPPPPSFGYSDLVPEFIRAAVSAAHRVHLPARSYLFFEGPLEGANEFGASSFTPEDFTPQSPNLFWPEDRAWCVASEIDLSCTFVAGSNALAESLLTNPALEAWRVFPGDPVTSDSDEINR